MLVRFNGKLEWDAETLQPFIRINIGLPDCPEESIFFAAFQDETFDQARSIFHKMKCVWHDRTIADEQVFIRLPQIDTIFSGIDSR